MEPDQFCWGSRIFLTVLKINPRNSRSSSQLTNTIYMKWVVNIGAAWCTFQPQCQKTKSIYPEKHFLYFSGKKCCYILRWNFPAPSLKKFLYFPPKILLYISMEPPAPGLKNKTKPKKQSEKFLIFFQKKLFFHISGWMLINRKNKTFSCPKINDDQAWN